MKPAHCGSFAEDNKWDCSFGVREQDDEEPLAVVEAFEALAGTVVLARFTEAGAAEGDPTVGVLTMATRDDENTITKAIVTMSPRARPELYDMGRASRSSYINFPKPEECCD
jgi:hypothetical protein